MRAKISGQEVRSGLDWSVGFGWASTDNPQRSPTEVSVGVKEMYMYVLDRAEDLGTEEENPIDKCLQLSTRLEACMDDVQLIDRTLKQRWNEAKTDRRSHQGFER